MESKNINYNLLIAKKTEKIVTAIYLISQFLKDTERIKIDLRGEANKLLKSVNVIAYQNKDEISAVYKECLDNVSILISFLTVAKDANIISKMNSIIVIEALRILENILAKKQFVLSKENLFINEENILNNFVEEKLENRFNTNTSFDTLSSRNIEMEIFEERSADLHLIKKEEINKNVSKGQNLENENIYKRQNINDIEKKKKKLESSDLTLSQKIPKNQGRKDNRRDQIMALFTKGVEVSINDISRKIIGCSVKTIQRELNDLVLENKIKKIGEKRWSKYILV